MDRITYLLNQSELNNEDLIAILHLALDLRLSDPTLPIVVHLFQESKLLPSLKDVLYQFRTKNILHPSTNFLRISDEKSSLESFPSISSDDVESDSESYEQTNFKLLETCISLCEYLLQSSVSVCFNYWKRLRKSIRLLKIALCDLKEIHRKQDSDFDLLLITLGKVRLLVMLLSKEERINFQFKSINDLLELENLLKQSFLGLITKFRMFKHYEVDFFQDSLDICDEDRCSWDGYSIERKDWDKYSEDFLEILESPSMANVIQNFNLNEAQIPVILSQAKKLANNKPNNKLLKALCEIAPDSDSLEKVKELFLYFQELLNDGSSDTVNSIKEMYQVAAGSAGDIFKAKFSGKIIAMKKINRSAWHRLKRETTALKVLKNCSNVIRIEGYFDEGEDRYILMEWFERGSLFDFLGSRPPISNQTRLEMAQETACGLAAVHKLGIVHRDLKSPNVLIRSDLTIAITDFDLAKFDTSIISTLADETKQNIASYYWRAPETLRNQEFSKASDIYALGVILWEIFSNKVPYSKEKDHHIIQIFIESGLFLNEIGILAFKIDDIVRYCCAMNRSERPSAEDVVLMLKNIRTRLKSSALEITSSPAPSCNNNMIQSGDLDELFLNSIGENCFQVLIKNHKFSLASELLSNNKALLDSTNANGLTALHVAAHCGDSVSIKWLIDNGANLALTTKDGNLPLHCAVLGNHLNDFEILLKKRSDLIHHQNEKGNTVLHIACGVGNLEMVKALIKMKANLQLRNNGMMTPYNYAINKGRLHVAVWLESILDERLTTNQVNDKPTLCNDNEDFSYMSNNSIQVDDGTLSLHIAVANDDFDSVKCLLGSQINFDSTNIIEEYAPLLHIAASTGSTKMIEFLLQIIELSKRVELSINLLHFSAKHGLLNAVKYLIEQQCLNISLKNKTGHTPLQLALKHGHLDTVKWLVANQGLPINILEEPLHYAVLSGDIEIVKWITACGVDLHHLDCLGKTALHLSVQHNFMDIAKWFVLVQNLNPNINDLCGKKPIHYAAEFGHFELVKWFVAFCGRSLNVVDNFNNPPLYYAAKERHLEVAKWFLTQYAGAESESDGFSLFQAVASGNLELLMLLTEEDVNFNVRDINDNTLLHSSASSCNLEITKWLVKVQGLSIDCINKFSLTPLCIAASKGDLDSIKWLASQQNVDLNFIDDQGKSMVHYAAISGNLDLVQWLVKEKKLNLDQTDFDDKMPLHFALQYGHIKLVKWIYSCKKSDFKSKCFYLRTVFHYAAQSGDPELLKWLTGKFGTAKILPDCNDEMPIHISATYGHLEAVKWLFLEYHKTRLNQKSLEHIVRNSLKSGNIDMICWLIDIADVEIATLNYDNQFNALDTAIYNRNLNIVIWMLDNNNGHFNASINESSLEVAAKGGNLDILKHLLNACEFNVDVDLNTKILDCAAENGNIKIVNWILDYRNVDPGKIGVKSRIKLIQMLVENGDIDMLVWLSKHIPMEVEINEQGDSALHLAAMHGQNAVARWLIENRIINPNSCNSLKKTALHFAAEFGNLSLVKWLIQELNMNPKITDIDGNTLLHLAISRGRYFVVKWILNSTLLPLNCTNASNHTPLHSAVSSGDLRLIKLLFNTFPEKTNQLVMDLLVISFRRGFSEVVRWLIQETSTAVQDICRNDANCFLRYAAVSGNLKLLNWMISNGADINSVDEEGESLLHYCAATASVNLMEWFCVVHNMDINARNKYNFTVLSLAIRNQNLSAIKWILDFTHYIHFPDDFEAIFNLDLTTCKGKRIAHFLLKKRYSDSKHPNLEKDHVLLCDSIAARNYNLVDFLINRRWIDPYTLYEKPLLHFAASRYNTDVIEWLVMKYNYCFNLPDDELMTLLHHAGKVGNLELVHWLFERQDVDVEAIDKYQNTILHYAALSRNSELVKWLLSKNRFNLDSRDSSGKTVLHNALIIGDIDVVQWLVVIRGMVLSDVNMKDAGKKALHYAASSGNLELVRWLVEVQKQRLEDLDDMGNNCLHYAILSDQFELVKWLMLEKHQVIHKKKAVYQYIAAKINPDMLIWLIEKLKTDLKSEEKGKKLIHYAAESGNYELAKWLIEKRYSKANDADDSGKNVLHYAIEGGNLTLIKWLALRRDVNLEKCDVRNTSPLMYAAKKGNKDLVEWLVLEYEVNLNMKNINGESVLHFAAGSGDIDLVEWLLITQRMNINEKNKEHKSALHFAADSGNLDLVKWLIEKKEVYYKKSFLHYVAATGNLELMKWLVEVKGESLESRDKQGKTCLHHAADGGNTELVKWLISKQRMDPKTRDDLGNPPRHYAIIRGHAETVKFLDEVAYSKHNVKF